MMNLKEDNTECKLTNTGIAGSA